MKKSNRRLIKAVVASFFVLLLQCSVQVLAEEIVLKDFKVLPKVNLIKLENNSFEYPKINPKYGWGYFHQDKVPGWKTTAKDNLIELQSTIIRIKAVDGNQYAELNAKLVSELYQELPTKPGTKMRWSLYHSGRQGVDTMGINIGADRKNKKRVETISTREEKWTLYKGSYTIPDNQHSTFFGFEAVKSASGTESEGNLLDNINFSTISLLEMTLEGPELGYAGEVVTYTVSITNKGGSTAILKNLSNIIPEGMNYEPGSVKLLEHSNLSNPKLTYNDSLRQFECQNFKINSGETTELTYQIRVPTNYSKISEPLVVEMKSEYHDELFENEKAYLSQSNEVITKLEHLQSPITRHYVNQKGQKIKESVIEQLNVASQYDYSQIEKIKGFTYFESQGSPLKGLVEKNSALEITFVYRPVFFELKQSVTTKDGKNANEVDYSSLLTYKLSLISQMTLEGEEDKEWRYFENLRLIEKLPQEVRKPLSFKLKDQNGRNVGKINYEAEGHQLRAEIKETDQVKSSDNLYLTYEVEVNPETEIGAIIKGKGTVEGKYLGESGWEIAEQSSNEVTSKLVSGKLVFVSAPKSLDFGTDLKVTAKDTEYSLKRISENLIVQDFRGKNRQWEITARMVQPLKNGRSILEEAMYYRRSDRGDQLIGAKVSAQITEHKTTSIAEVNLSENWSETNEPVIKINAGEAKLGTYQGIILWTLNDIPN